MRSAGEE